MYRGEMVREETLLVLLVTFYFRKVTVGAETLLVLLVTFYFRRETVGEETLRVASMLVSSESFREVDVVDFDNHFNDITRDWRNIQINDLLERCT
jgi:hypothetical protein